MKKRITSLMLILVVAVSMTMGASAASYIPDDVTYQNLNGQQLAIKTYTLLPDQDPSDLYEDDFEYDGFLYSMSDIVKEEQRYQEENAHTEVVTVTTASKNLEDILIERIKENKSLVDIRLTTGTCREYYQHNVDSFILVSSDSDYWGLISAMPEVRFFVMVESEKCSPTIKNALINAGISYCYIDDFCTGNSNDIKVAAVLREVRQKLDQAFHLNVRDILDEACRATRADMTTAEKNQFYDKYIKTMHVDISPNGEATIVLGK